MRKEGPGLIEFCDRFEAVELWADPEPNDQLTLIWLLDYLRPHAEISSQAGLDSVGCLHRQSRAGRIGPAGGYAAVNILSDHLEIASAAWQAYRAPTPQDWFDLLARISTSCRSFGSTLLELLEELPVDATGLGADGNADAGVDSGR